jgi:hypothetical protein
MNARPAVLLPGSGKDSTTALHTTRQDDSLDVITLDEATVRATTVLPTQRMVRVTPLRSR